MSIGFDIGRTDGTFNPHKIRTFGKRVALEILDNRNERKVGDIIIPERFEQNMRMSKYIVKSIDPEYSKETGIQEGDYVMADRLARYYDTTPVSVIDAENIIMKVDRETGKMVPLRNKVFVKEDKVEDQFGCIIIQRALVPFGTVIAENLDDDIRELYNIEVGKTKIVMTKDSDNICVEGEWFRIYDEKDLIAALTEMEERKED